MYNKVHDFYTVFLYEIFDSCSVFFSPSNFRCFQSGAGLAQHAPVPEARVEFPAPMSDGLHWRQLQRQWSNTFLTLVGTVLTCHMHRLKNKTNSKVSFNLL